MRTRAVEAHRPAGDRGGGGPTAVAAVNRRHIYTRAYYDLFVTDMHLLSNLTDVRRGLHSSLASAFECSIYTNKRLFLTNLARTSKKTRIR